jgi:hypothetical protein
MATKFKPAPVVYGLNQALVQVPPMPITALRDPTTADQALLGAMWINTATNSVYTLASVSGNVANWVTSAGSGVGTFTSIDVSGNVHVTGAGSNVTVDQGNLTLSNGNVSVVGNTTLNGDLSVTGDFDVVDAVQVGITSSDNGIGAIALTTNGGAAATLEIQNTQGTGNASVNVASTVGGVTVIAGKTASTAINLTTNGVGGGLTMTTGIGGINGTTTGVLSLNSALASNITVTGATRDLTLASVGGSVNITATEAAANSIHLGTAAGGGMDVVAGTLGVAIDATGTSHFTVTGAAADATVSSVGGSVNLAASEAAANAISISASDIAGGITAIAGTGGLTATVTGGKITLTSTNTANDAITLTASTGTAGIGIIGGSNGVAISSATGNVGMQSVAGQAIMQSAKVSSDAVSINAPAVGGGIHLTAGTTALDGTIFLDCAQTSVRCSYQTSAVNTIIINAHNGIANFTGFTTAAAASQSFIITNSALTDVHQAILVTANNGGANDAQMTVTRVLAEVGTLTVTLKNNGAAALNGDVNISFWLMS